MDAVKDILSNNTKRVLLELFLISTLLFAPVTSYALAQGIPAIKLLSLPTLIVSAAISYLTVAIFILVGLYLKKPLGELYSKDPAVSPFRTRSKIVKWVVYVTVHLTLFSSLLSSAVSMARTSGWASPVFTLSVVGLCLFRGWHLISPHWKAGSEPPEPNGPQFENLKFDLHEMPFNNLTFDLKVTPPTPDEDKNGSPSNSIFWLLFLFVTCGIGAGIATNVLSPLGKLSLRFSNMGGELPVELEHNGTPTTASLILETTEGWFVRFDGHCKELSWIKSDDLKDTKRLEKKDSYGSDLGACVNQPPSGNENAK